MVFIHCLTASFYQPLLKTTVKTNLVRLFKSLYVIQQLHCALSIFLPLLYRRLIQLKVIARPFETIQSKKVIHWEKCNRRQELVPGSKVGQAAAAEEELGQVRCCLCHICKRSHLLIIIGVQIQCFTQLLQHCQQ